jgi:hypothetical protein
MTTHVLTLGLNATTTYTNFDFDSYCVGPDGTVYAIKSDGLYTLEGGTDNGTEIAATIDFGDLNFDSSQLKRCDAIYLAVGSAEPMAVSVNGYDYETRGSSEDMTEQRADIGKGIRSTFFTVSASNQRGSDFDLESLEVRANVLGRKV